MTDDGTGHARIHFETDDAEAEARFLRAYVLEAVDRLPDTGICDRFVFVRAGHSPEIAGGAVVVDIFGDPEAVIERERGTWDRLVEDGPLAGWERSEVDLLEELAEHFGAEAVDRHEQLRFVAGAMSRPAFEHLEERPAPVEDVPGSDGAPVGWHRVLHILSNHWGYDIDEELDAHVENVATCLEIIGKTEGPEATRERAAEIRERLSAVVEGLETGREAADD